MRRGLGSFIAGMVAFAGGVAAGLLLAPKSGKENRQWIQDQSADARDWFEGKSHDLLEESERRIDQVSKGFKKTVQNNLPDLYEATESFSLDEDDLKDA